MTLKLRFLLAVTALKLLLVPAYRSTDFEVHRNWLAITYSLPLKQWYTEATSEWTLDYPPLFAWFEWALAQAARFVDAAMLRLDNLNYASWGTVAFQRLSVIASELVLVTALLCLTRHMRRQQGDLAWLLVLGSPGLLLVDHIHFQYNGMLLGLLLWSIVLLEDGRDLAGAIAYAVLVNMKHLYACLAPLYVIYLLRHYCRGPNKAVRFLSLAAAVAAVCGASFGPFIILKQLPQVLSRLFPFQRGLCHAYWAANWWALYSAADRALAFALPRLGRGVNAAPAASTGGLVGVAPFAVLPQVSPAATLAVTLAAMLPCLVALARRPEPRRVLPAAAYCCLCAFAFGYHVHEKAVLMATLPLAVEAVRAAAAARDHAVLAAAGHMALLPLLFTLQEAPIKVLLVALYTVAANTLLRELHSGQQEDGSRPGLLAALERLYLWLMAPLQLYCGVLHPALLQRRLPFLPLLLTSVYAACGVLYVWSRMFARYCRQAVRPDKAPDKTA